MPSFHYTLRRLEEIYDLSVLLAQSFPDPTSVKTGIYELLINALEHGNLGIGHELKTLLVRENRWEDEIKHRLALPEFSNTQVDITLEKTEAECRVTITDQGKGFNWPLYMSPPAVVKNKDRSYGLGLRLVQNSGFDAVTFNAPGNEVTCIVKSKEL